MKIHELEHKKILIAGYGIEGKATHAFLKKFVPTATVGIADQEKDGVSYLDVQGDYDLVIKTPGIKKELITIPYTTATNIFFANLDSRHTTIGVTGTKGKSTTASLIYHILKTRGIKTELIGNIGRPMLDILIEEPTADTTCVIELSSYQLADITYSPDISLVVSLYPDHIPYHGSVESYFEAKHQILSHARADQFYVYNPAFPKLVEWAATTEAHPVPYESTFEPTHSRLLGRHNRDNVRGAFTVTNILGISYQDADLTLDTFQALPHRLEKVGEFEGITFYDDAISTTPESTIAALDALPLTKTIFLGGEDRGYDFKVLSQELISRNIQAIVLFPDSGTRILSELEKLSMESIQVCQTSSMQEAVTFAYKHTPQGSVCLLSTASPSYSLWKNFIEKGNQFQQFVKEYAKAP
ncbi:UDP-N-acetylmuramoyl-L-alanine--D-glutamate ligase [Candidatus Woesebacteria bacterium]|nr:UDP-N-acetylmuramoyl-L-alanine--D-glutamate ligase [Candidatus Woesebacteria bacterium]